MARRGRPPNLNPPTSKRGRPPKLNGQAIKPIKPGRPPKLDAQAAKRGRPRKSRELNKSGEHHVKRGRPPKQRNEIKSCISPLPLCPPPAIHPFRDQGASIEWGERLDALPGSGSDAKSFVFKVKINSAPYVVKVFKFYDPLATKWFWGDQLGEEYPLEKAIVYTDPFYAECRAYGRIKEALDKGDIREKIAAKCHGYIFLDADAQRWLENQGIDLGTDMLNEELIPIVGGAGRPRAIVKDFEIAGPALDKQTPLQIRKCFRRVWLLNKLGIYNRDVREDNFRNGWLVDFDTSYTLPHDLYSALPPFEAKATQGEDVAMFEDMLEEAGINMKFLATKKYNLRPRLKENQYCVSYV
ncbi:kinetochore Sim4 complex subunit FTA2-domain-containing protein [Xylaria palmicola]|nr:kinetochore Sim4 complex subunit FTA2-domain-containing protein [Xylaria palmicola]